MAIIIHLLFNLFNENQLADKTRHQFQKERILKGVTRLFFITATEDEHWANFLQRCTDGNGTCSPEEIQQLIGGQAPGAIALDPSRQGIQIADQAWFVYFLGLAAQVCYETVQVSNQTRGLIKAWRVPINKDVQHPTRMSSYHDVMSAVESIKNGYIENVEKAEEEDKSHLTPPPHESVWNLFNAVDGDTQMAVREYTSNMTLFPAGFDLDRTSLDELVQTANYNYHSGNTNAQQGQITRQIRSTKARQLHKDESAKTAEGKGDEYGPPCKPSAAIPRIPKTCLRRPGGHRNQRMER